MAFEVIECLNPPKVSNEKVPDQGILIAPRKLGSRNGKEIRYIRLQIGSKLASGVSLTQEGQKVLLLFGTEADAGKIRVAVPSAKGGGALRPSGPRPGPMSSRSTGPVRMACSP